MVCQGSRRAPRSWDYLHNVCILSSRSCFIFIFEAQRGCWVFVWFRFFFCPSTPHFSWVFPLPLSAPPHLPTAPTMARMNRPAPVEVCYKNMRFLITHNPTNATLSTFLEVRRGDWKVGTGVQLHLLGLMSMRWQHILFSTTAGGILGQWVPSLQLFGTRCFSGHQV